jgi:hypothetical protein
MSRIKFAALLFAAALTGVSAFAQATFTRIDNPGDPTFNQALGINDSGVISGYFGSGVQGHPNQGYTVAPPYTTYAPDNFPGSVQSQATGIADNEITVGLWSPTNTGTDGNYGFIRTIKNGNYSFVNVNNPLASGNPAVTQVRGISESNIAVGFYNDANGASHGYTYTVGSGKFAAVNVAGAVSAAATGISNDGMVCGFFTNAAGKTQGFVKPLSGVSLTTFAVPGATVTQFLGISNVGVAVGFYIGSDTFHHGVAYNLATGAVIYIDDPNGTMGTVLNGVNNKGQIVGFYTDAADNTHGMLVNGAL